MIVVMQGRIYTDNRWPWFVAKSKHAAVKALHAFGYRKERDIYCNGGCYAVIEDNIPLAQDVKEDYA